jgi:hypothetical protein
MISARLCALACFVAVMSSGCAGRGVERRSADAPVATIAAMPRPAVAVPFTRAPPRMNADPNDRAWSGAAVIESLSLSQGAPATRAPAPTRVQLLWDPSYLYVRFRCQDENVYVPHGMRRDAPHHEGDVVEVFLDPLGDGRQYIEIQVNPNGGIFDLLHLVTTDDPPTEDLTLPRRNWARDHWPFPDWNLEGLVVAARARTPTGAAEEQRVEWIVDIAIPARPTLRRLGLRNWQPMALRANFMRYEGDADPVTGKRDEFAAMNWAQVRHGLPHLSPAAMGRISLAPPP